MKDTKSFSMTGLLTSVAGISVGIFVPMLISIIIRLFADAMTFASDTIATGSSIAILFLGIILIDKACKYGVGFIKFSLLGVIIYQILSMAGISIAVISMVHPAVVTEVSGMSITGILILFLIMKTTLIILTYLLLYSCGGKEKGICKNESISTSVMILGMILVFTIITSIIFDVFLFIEMGKLNDYDLTMTAWLVMALDAVLYVIIAALRMGNKIKFVSESKQRCLR